MIQDYVQNGRGHGPVGESLNSVEFDPGYLRPYIDKNNRIAITVNTGRWTVEKGERKLLREHRLLRDVVNNGDYTPPYRVTNATTLRKEEWLLLDQVVLRAARYRLIAWNDLAKANSFGGFNGMSKMVLEHETMADPGEALVDMDAVTDDRSDQPLFQLQGLPLAITHSGFSLSARRLAVSRNTNTPLDSTLAEASSRRVAERVEKTTVGVSTGITTRTDITQTGGYGRSPSVYGYTNFPARITFTTLTAPTNGAWTPETTQQQVNTCLNVLRNQKFYGPFMLYHSNDWDPYMDGDYYVSKTSGAVAPNTTLRDRLRKISGIVDVKRLDFLFGTQPSASTGPGGDVDVVLKPFRLVFVQQTPDVARAVTGLDITTVQWEEKGGLKLGFKVMCICVPQLRADFYGNCGILDATTS